MSRLRIGQRVRLVAASRAKYLWDRAGYSTTVPAGAVGEVASEQLLDRDGHPTTVGFQELRGYRGIAGYEVMFRLPRIAGAEPAWVYTTSDKLEAVQS